MAAPAPAGPAPAGPAPAAPAPAALPHTAPYTRNHNAATLAAIFVPVQGVHVPIDPTIIRSVNGVLHQSLMDMNHSIFLHPHANTTQAVLNIAAQFNPNYLCWNKYSLPYDCRYEKPCGKEQGKIRSLNHFSRKTSGQWKSECNNH